MPDEISPTNESDEDRRVRIIGRHQKEWQQQEHNLRLQRRDYYRDEDTQGSAPGTERKVKPEGEF